MVPERTLGRGFTEAAQPAVAHSYQLIVGLCVYMVQSAAPVLSVLPYAHNLGCVSCHAVLTL